MSSDLDSYWEEYDREYKECNNNCSTKKGSKVNKAETNAKFKDRAEQRRVTETMNALLLPLLPRLNNDTATIVERALYLLKEIEIEPQATQTKKNKKTEDNWLYETGREEPEILGSGSTYYNVVSTKDEKEAMKLSKEKARNYLRRTQTKNGVTITQEYSYQVGWINI